MRKYLLLILILSLALSALIGQVVVPKPGSLNQIPILVNDSLMFIGADVDSLTEEQRYFNPLYLIVHKGKEHLKKQLVVASVCDCDPTIPTQYHNANQKQGISLKSVLHMMNLGSFCILALWSINLHDIKSRL